jgi:type IV pilus assembly protein PilB
MTRKKRIGEVLIEAGLLNETQLAAALNSQRTWGGKLGSTLVRMGFVREEDILKCLSDQLRLPSVDFRRVQISARAKELVPLRIAERYNVIPVTTKEELGKKLVVLAMSDPTNLDAISEIQFQTGITVRPVVATESAITRAIEQYYRDRTPPGPAAPGERVVDLAAWDEAEEMVILQKGDERRVSGLDGVDSRELLQVLLRLLEAKGLVSRQEIEEALRRKS